MSPILQSKGVTTLKALSLSCYPHLRTRQELATACRDSRTIFLCGQASRSDKLAIARALAQEVSEQEILYISCESSKKTSHSHPSDAVIALSSLHPPLSAPRNLSAIFLYDNFSEKIHEAIQTFGSTYDHYIIGFSNSDTEETGSFFPAAVDTALLLPGKLENRQLHALMVQIYDHDYTIAGVVEAETIHTLQMDELSSKSSKLYTAEVN